MYRIIYVELFNGGFCEPVLSFQKFESKDDAKLFLFNNGWQIKIGSYVKTDVQGINHISYIVKD